MNKQQIMSAKKRKIHSIAVPQWGGEVNIRSWTAKELRAVNTMPADEIVGFVVQRSLCDEAGELLFTDEERDDVLDNDMETLNYLVKEVMKVCGASVEESKSAPQAPAK